MYVHKPIESKEFRVNRMSLNGVRCRIELESLNQLHLPIFMLPGGTLFELFFSRTTYFGLGKKPSKRSASIIKNVKFPTVLLKIKKKKNEFAVHTKVTRIKND